MISLIVAIPLRIFTFGRSQMRTIQDVDPGVVLVFGAGLRPDGTPSDALGDRLKVAAALYDAGKAEHILVSGDNRFEDYNEPEVMHDTLVAVYGIPEEVIEEDFAGRRTYDTCIRAHELWDVHAAILVTQAFHLPRAIWTCQQLGIESVGVSASLQSYIRDAYYRRREVLAMYKAWFDVNIWEPDYVKGRAEEDLSAYAE